MKKTSILLLLLVAIIFGACKKEIVQEANKKQLRTMNGTLMTMPTVQNDILTFDSEDQFTTYVQFLRDQIEASPDLEIDEILWNIEEQVGFTNSYRKIKADAFDAQNIIGWTKTDDIPEDPFGKIEQSIMNQYKEYRIGRDVYKNMSTQFDIVIKAEDEAKAEEILTSSRIMQEGNSNVTLSQIRSLDWSKKHLVINDLSINGWEITPSIVGGGNPLAQYELSGLVHSMNACGGQLNKAVIRSMTLINTTNPYTPLSAYYDVDFGDGTAYTNYPGVGGMFGVELYDEHQYATSGTYTITIKARATNNGQIVVTQSYTITVTGNTTCSNASKTKTYWYEIDATHKLKCKITYNKRNHLLQGPCADGLGQAEYYVKEGTTWKNKKAEAIGVSLFSYGYKNENNIPCTLYGATPEQSKWLDNISDVEFNKKSCDAGHIRTIQLKWITIEGTFKVTFGGQSHTKKYIMSSCD